MIAVAPTIADCWPELVALCLQLHTPQEVTFPDGVTLRCEVAYGIIFAQLSVAGRLLTDAEDQALVAGCAIPEGARRVPEQRRQHAAIRRGDEAGDVVDSIAYRWLWRKEP